MTRTSTAFSAPLPPVGPPLGDTGEMLGVGTQRRNQMGKMTRRALGERGGRGLRGCRASWETTARVSHRQTLVEGLSRSLPRCWGHSRPQDAHFLV